MNKFCLTNYGKKCDTFRLFFNLLPDVRKFRSPGSLQINFFIYFTSVFFMLLLSIYLDNLLTDNISPSMPFSVLDASAQTQDTSIYDGIPFSNPPNSNPNLDALNKTIPVLSRISHNDTYEVQVLWSIPQSLQSPNILPVKGFNMQILFLDASAPEPENRTLPKFNLLSDELKSIPVIKPLIPVTNYDITIYSQEGEILWQENNNTPSGGRAVERVILDNPYEGIITISITDITSPIDDGVDAVQIPARLI